MNKIKSPLKHEEGNALAHGMYADEAAWHKKNDGGETKQTDEETKVEETDSKQPFVFTPVVPDGVDIQLQDFEKKRTKKEKKKNIQIEGTILDENDLETLKFIKDPEKREKVKQNLINEKTKKRRR